MTPKVWEELNKKYKVITYSQEIKKLDTNPIRNWFVQGENQTTGVAIVGPSHIKAIDLQKLRMAIRISSDQYETTVEKTLDETQLIDEETYMMLWIVGKEETAVPGNLSVSLIGYGGDEEVIKISSDGITIKADDLEEQAPPESTWQQILSQIQAFATQALQSKNDAEQAAQTSAEKAEEASTSAQMATQKAEEASTSAQMATQKAEEASTSAQMATQKAAEATAAATTAATDAAAQTAEEIKAFADDRYARALVVTDGPAESLTIYPDAGSNISITSHGYTEQSGTGDPSPTNVRPIKVGGLRLRKVTINGKSGSWREVNPETGVKFYACDGVTVDAPFKTLIGYCDIVKFVGSSALEATGIGAAASRTSLYLGVPNVKSKEEMVAWADKNPVTFWHAVADESNSTGIYTPQISEGESYHCNCIELRQPLCDSDKVDSNVPSGCDKVLVLDGSTENVEWDSTYETIYVNLSTNVYAHTLGMVLSNKCVAVKSTSGFDGKGTIPAISTSVTLSKIALSLPGVNSVESYKNYMQTNGNITVFYRSTEYTPKKDIKVCMEKHVRGYTVVDGVAIVFEQGTDGYKVTSTNAQNGAVKCNRFNNITVESNAVTIPASQFPVEVTNLQQANEWVKTNNVQLEYELVTPITYAQPDIRMEADPKTSDTSVKVSGEKTVSATYNKSLAKAIQQLQAAMLVLSANFSL